MRRARRVLIEASYIGFEIAAEIKELSPHYAKDVEVIVATLGEARERPVLQGETYTI